MLEVVKEAISAQQRQAPVMREVKKKVFWGECAWKDRMGHTYENVYRRVREKAADGDLECW